MNQINAAAENLIKGVKKHGDLWMKYEDASKAACDAAQNTLNLLECCLKSDIEGTLLGEVVPSIKSNLIVKLLLNLNPSLAVLHNNLDDLSQCPKRIMSCVRSFETVLKSVSLYSCAEGSAVLPSATYMYETVVSLAFIMFEVVAQRKDSLCSIEKDISAKAASGDDFVMPMNWNTDTRLTEKLNEILAWDQFKIGRGSV